MKRPEWILSILSWDGCLPLVVILVPRMLELLFPAHQVAILAVGCLLLPFTAVMWRAHAGIDHLQRAVGGPPGLFREVVFALGIIALLLFEMGVGMIRFAQLANRHAHPKDRVENPVPPEAWLFVVAFFVVYLASILVALRPVEPLQARERGEAEWY